MDTSNAKLYKCIYVANGAYYWTTDGAAPTFNTSASGSVVTVKDAVAGSVKTCSVSGDATTITRVGSNFFDGVLETGLYANTNLNLESNYSNYRSFKAKLPKGKYSLCFSNNVCIVKNKVNDEFSGTQILDVSAYGFTVNAYSEVAFSFRGTTSDAPWDENTKVWIARGTESSQYSAYEKQELSVADANQLTLLYGQNHIYTDADNAQISLTYVADGTLYVEEQLSTRPNHKIASMIRNGEISKIKVIGDSITHGVGGTGFQESFGDGEVICVADGMNVSFRVNNSGCCWANKFKNYIETKYPNVSVDCWGTRGMSTETWLNDGSTFDGVRKSCLEQLISDEDDLVVCMIGTNDRTHRKNTEEFSLYMQQVIEYILNRGKKLLLLASVPASLANETEVYDDGSKKQHFHMEDVNNLICHFANRYGVWFISLYNAMNRYLSKRFSI